jgi:hypothetical protein
MDQQFKRLEIHFRKDPPRDAFDIVGIKEISRDGNHVFFEIKRNLNALMEKALPYGIEDIEIQSVSLEEIFLSFYGPESKGGKDD